MNQKPLFFDPATAVTGRQGEGIVLKPRPFKPLRNTKTGNFFSYSFAVINRNRSPNSSNNMEWVSAAPIEMQKRIDHVRTMHNDLVVLHADLVQAMKDEDKPATRRAEAAIKKQTAAIGDYIYPEEEREYVESHEAKRFRLEQQNELTLDAASIAALRGDGAPMGTTADASIAQAKLEVAEAKIKKLEEEAKDAKMVETKPAPVLKARPKAAAAKPK